MDFLVIDDDKTFRDATCFLIEEAGHYAEGVESGRLGLEWLKEDKWGAVLLDVNLGKENGLDVLAEIQKQFPQVAVIMFTAQGSVKVAVEAMRRGAVDFLEKPFQREQFMTVLARLQRLKQMSQRIERLEQVVTETKAQSLEPIFDFTTPKMQEIMDVLMRAAKTPASILIFGESSRNAALAKSSPATTSGSRTRITAPAVAVSGTVASVVASPMPMSSARAARTAWRISAADNSTPQRWS